MDATRAEPPYLSDEQLAEMRVHLLGEIERDARRRERRARRRSFLTGRRRVLVVVLALLATMYAVPAVAEEKLWWMGPHNTELQPVTPVLTLGNWTARELTIGPSPETGPVPAAPFSFGGERWTFQAFVSKEAGLCVGASPDPPQPANEGAFLGCGHPVHGIPLTYKPDELHWVGFGAGIPGRVDLAKAKFMSGPANERVRTVDLEDHLNHRVIHVPTIPPPKGLGVPARFWIALVPLEHVVNVIVPRDEDGNALEHWRLPTAQ